MRVHELRDALRKLRNMVSDPQSSLPDVLLWMIVDKKRVAYYRFSARDLIYYPQTADTTFTPRGKLCGKPHTVFLRVRKKIFFFYFLFLIAFLST